MKSKSIAQIICTILLFVFFGVNVLGITQNILNYNLGPETFKELDIDQKEFKSKSIEKIDKILEKGYDEAVKESDWDVLKLLETEAKSFLKCIQSSITDKGLGFSELRLVRFWKSLLAIIKKIDKANSESNTTGYHLNINPAKKQIQIKFVILLLIIFVPLLVKLILAVCAIFFNKKPFYIIAVILESIGLIGNFYWLIDCYIEKKQIGSLVEQSNRLSDFFPFFPSISKEATLSVSLGIGWYLLLLASVGFLACCIILLVQKNPAAASAAALIGLTGTYMGSVIRLNPNEEIIIGRDANVSHLILPEKTVSRKHCGIRYDMGRKVYQVIDYSSTGTQLGNGQEIPKNVYFDCMSGNIIQIGKNRFQLQ